MWLKAELGVRLFERHSRGVALTTDSVCIPTLSASRRWSRRHAGPRPRPMTALRAARSASAPRKRRRRCACHRCSSSIRTPAGGGGRGHRPPAALVRDVLEHRLDAALVAGPVAIPSWRRRQPSRRNWCWSRRPVCAARMYWPERAISRCWCFGLAALIGNDWKRSWRPRASPARRLEFCTLDGIVGCVAARVGVTLLPRAVVEPAWRQGRVALHTLPAAEAKDTTILVRHHDAYVSSALKAFLHAIRGDQPLARAAA